jgi:hypothetical protein
MGSPAESIRTPKLNEQELVPNVRDEFLFNKLLAYEMKIIREVTEILRRNIKLRVSESLWLKPRLVLTNAGSLISCP